MMNKVQVSVLTVVFFFLELIGNALGVLTPAIMAFALLVSIYNLAEHGFSNWVALIAFLVVLFLFVAETSKYYFSFVSGRALRRLWPNAIIATAKIGWVIVLFYLFLGIQEEIVAFLIDERGRSESYAYFWLAIVWASALFSFVTGVIRLGFCYTPIRNNALVEFEKGEQELTNIEGEQS